MPPELRSSPVPEDRARSGRHRWLLVVLGALVAVSLVLAALVIFSRGGSTAGPGAEEQEVRVRTSEESLILGSPDAPVEVVVFEDFGSAESRAFVIASRDFLQIEASRGTVLVEYHPLATATSGESAYSDAALAAWGAILREGSAEQALALHDLIFDRQPVSGEPVTSEFIAMAKHAGVVDEDLLASLDEPDPDLVATAGRAAERAGVTTTPTVLVDGSPLSASSPTELADRLQRMLLEQ